MATRSKSKVVEADESTADVFRLSITLDPRHRRDIRIAAAMADKTTGEWATEVLTRAADREINRGGEEDEG